MNPSLIFYVIKWSFFHIKYSKYVLFAHAYTRTRHVTDKLKYEGNDWLESTSLRRGECFEKTILYTIHLDRIRSWLFWLCSLRQTAMGAEENTIWNYCSYRFIGCPDNFLSIYLILMLIVVSCLSFNQLSFLLNYLASISYYVLTALLNVFVFIFIHFILLTCSRVCFICVQIVHVFLRLRLSLS